MHAEEKCLLGELYSFRVVEKGSRGFQIMMEIKGKQGVRSPDLLVKSSFNYLLKSYFTTFSQSFIPFPK